MSRQCEWCKGPIDRAARRDTKTCSKKCRQAKHRFRIGVAPRSSHNRSMRFAYADPPYPGLARKYYGKEASEVNHRILIGYLLEHFPNGWALSTSAAALQEVLELCPTGVRVASWIKGARPVNAHRARSAWEPVIIWGGRVRQIAPEDCFDDVLIWGGRQHSHPDALVGMKPAAFCEWMFRLLGAERQDDLTDIFPGSGAVSRAWKLYTSRLPGSGESRLSEAQSRLTEQLDKFVPRCAHCGRDVERPCVRVGDRWACENHVQEVRDGPTLKLVPSQ